MNIPSPVLLWLRSDSGWKPALADSDGHFQVDVLSCANPSNLDTALSGLGTNLATLAGGVSAGHFQVDILTQPTEGTKVKTYTWVISSPAVGGVLGPRIPEAQTVSRIDAYVQAATSVTFNIEERSAIGSAGTNIMTSDLAADADGAAQTEFANPSLASGNWLYVDISAVSGTPGQVVITLTTEVD